MQHLDVSPDNSTEYRGKWNIEDVVRTIKDAVRESVPQVKSLAKSLRKGNLEDDARSVWDFIRANVRYVEDADAEGRPAEKIKTAARTLTEGEGDCEDMTILASALLINMEHSPKGAIIAQSGGSSWSHIFGTVGDFRRGDSEKLRGYVIDAVPEIPSFNAIAPRITKVMDIEFLRGIGHADGPAIGGMGCIQPASAVTKQLQGYQSALLTVAGLGSAAGDQSHTARELRKTRALILMNGLPEQEVLMGVMNYVHDVDSSGSLVFTTDSPMGAITDYLNDNLEGIGSIGLFKKKAKLKEAAEKEIADNANVPEEKKKSKALELIKKVGHGILKYNPATILIRNGVLLALKLNLFKLAERLHYGYLSDLQAQDAGLDMTELSNLRKQIESVEKVFHTLGGNPENLKHAIMKGGEKGLKGIGIVVAATATAGTAAATPFLVKIGDLLKKVNIKKLLEKANPGKIKQALSLVKSKTQEVPDEDQAPADGATGEGFKDDAEKTAYTNAQRSNAADQNTPGATDDKKSNTLIYIGLAAAAGLLLVTQMHK